MKRRCPDCGGFVILEAQDGNRYDWTCLNCGWRRDTKAPDLEKPKQRESRPRLPVAALSPDE